MKSTDYWKKFLGIEIFKIEYYFKWFLYRFLGVELPKLKSQRQYWAERGNSYILQMDKTYGWTRLRPPEEYCKGERIDQRANVFMLGRYAVCALSEQIDENWRDGFQGSVELADVIERATHKDRDERYDRVREFVTAFTSAAQQG